MNKFLNAPCTFFAASALTLASSMLFASPSYGVCVSGGLPSVEDFVTPTGLGSSQYSYKVSLSPSIGCASAGRIGPAISRFAVPYFTDAGITSIDSPTGWNYTIADVDTFGLGFGAKTLQWAVDTMAPSAVYISLGGSLSGFEYTANYGPAKGPFLVSGGGNTVIGDPAIPGSPNALAAGLEPLEITAVPEPSGGAFLYSLLVAGVIVRFRRNRPQPNQEF
jgi:hypothetical protein